MALAYQWLPEIDLSAHTTQQPTYSGCAYAQNLCIFQIGYAWVDLEYSNFTMTEGSATSVISGASGTDVTIINANYEAILLSNSAIKTYSGSSGGSFGSPVSTTAVSLSGFQNPGLARVLGSDFSVLMVDKGSEIWVGDILTGYTEKTITGSVKPKGQQHSVSSDGTLIAGYATDSNGEVQYFQLFEDVAGTWTSQSHQISGWSAIAPHIYADSSSIFATDDTQTNAAPVRIDSTDWNAVPTVYPIDYQSSSYSVMGGDESYFLLAGDNGSTKGGVQVVYTDGVTPTEYIEGLDAGEYWASNGLFGPIPTSDGEIYLCRSGAGLYRPLLLTDFPTAGTVIPDFWTNFQNAIER